MPALRQVFSRGSFSSFVVAANVHIDYAEGLGGFRSSFFVVVVIVVTNVDIKLFLKPGGPIKIHLVRVCQKGRNGVFLPV